jgi:hypothetical protein
MKRHQFTTIEQVRKAQNLLRSGTLVGERREGFYKIQLFQLPHCYLEVYKHAHFNVTIKINRFTDTAFLEPYLAQISLDQLF